MRRRGRQRGTVPVDEGGRVRRRGIQRGTVHVNEGDE